MLKDLTHRAYSVNLRPQSLQNSAGFYTGLVYDASGLKGVLTIKNIYMHKLTTTRIQ